MRTINCDGCGKEIKTKFRMVEINILKETYVREIRIDLCYDCFNDKVRISLSNKVVGGLK